MTKVEFLRTLESQLELIPGTLNEDATLARVEGWDSMATVLFIALADEKLGASISGNQVSSAKTVRDLVSLVNDRLAN